MEIEDYGIVLNNTSSDFKSGFITAMRCITDMAKNKQGCTLENVIWLCTNFKFIDNENNKYYHDNKLEILLDFVKKVSQPNLLWNHPEIESDAMELLKKIGAEIRANILDDFLSEELENKNDSIMRHINGER